jgi:hypothetical protein
MDIPDSAIKRSRPETEALTDVLKEEVPFDFSVKSDL